MLSMIGRWWILSGCYLALTGRASVAELVAASLVGLAGVLIVPVLRTRASRPLVLHAPWLRLSARSAALIACDVVKVAGVLVQALRVRRTGRLVRKPGAVRHYRAPAAARRALAVTFTSISPNEFALDAHGDDLVVHQLA